MDRDGIEIALDALDWPALVRPGSLVVWGQGCAEPNGLTAALMDARHAVGPFRAFAASTGLSNASHGRHAKMRRLLLVTRSKVLEPDVLHQRPVGVQCGSE